MNPVFGWLLYYKNNDLKLLVFDEINIVAHSYQNKKSSENWLNDHQ